MSYVLFKDEKAIYVVDIISLKSSPNTRWADGPEDWIAAIQAIEALDFDVVIGGHGPAGTKADVTQLREYFEDVIATVSEGIERGESLQALQKSIKMEKYSAWQGHSDRLPAHIANAYAYLQAG
jgi:glyoxylase-like metal-dependent hydrolase (beta-lactamase superfamily II)